MYLYIERILEASKRTKMHQGYAELTLKNNVYNDKIFNKSVLSIYISMPVYKISLGSLTIQIQYNLLITNSDI